MDIDATDPSVARGHRFPGSPTIRVDGSDVDPSFQDPGDYTPRYRLYNTAAGLRGVAERSWVEAALRARVGATTTHYVTKSAQGRAPGTQRLPRGRWVGGLAVAVAIVWGLCFVLIQTSLPSPTPLLLAGLRALIGGGVLAIWVAFRRARRADSRVEAASSQVQLLRADLPAAPLLLGLALTNATLAFGAMYLAAGQAEAAVASILAGGQPLVLAAAGWALFGDRISLRSGAGLAVAMIGVVVVATASMGATSLGGVGLALLAAAAPAVGTVLMRRLASTIDLVVTTGAQFLLGGVILLAVSAVFEPWGEMSWSPATLAGLLVLGIIGTGFAYMGWFWLLDRVSFVRLGAALFLVPVVGVTAGILAGDRPGQAELIGIVALLVGIGIASIGGSSAIGGASAISTEGAEPPTA